MAEYTVIGVYFDGPVFLGMVPGHVQLEGQASAKALSDTFAWHVNADDYASAKIEARGQYALEEGECAGNEECECAPTIAVSGNAYCAEHAPSK